MITLKVGEGEFLKISDAGSTQFADIRLPKGEIRLEAIRREGEKEVGSYQLIVTTATGSAKP